MKSQQLANQFWLRNLLLLVAPVFLLGQAFAFDFARAEPVGGYGYGYTRENEFSNTLPGQKQNKTILDATNPMEFMNQLRQATAMDNATSPADAIDQALKALEAENEIQDENILFENPGRI